MWYVACHAFELHAVQYTTSTCVHPLPSHAPLPCHHIKGYTAEHGVQKVPLEVAVALQRGIYLLLGLTSQRAEPDSRPLRPRPPQTSVGSLSLRPSKQQHCPCPFSVENIRLTLLPFGLRVYQVQCTSALDATTSGAPLYCAPARRRGVMHLAERRGRRTEWQQHRDSLHNARLQAPDLLAPNLLQRKQLAKQN